MIHKLPYDKTSPLSIEDYAKKLIGLSFKNVLERYVKLYHSTNLEETLSELVTYYNNPRSKGGLGLLIEKHYFLYEPNSDSEPDFAEAGVELKVTPYRQNKNGSYSAAERLVIGMIPNNEPLSQDFETSDVFQKIRTLLLIIYLRDKAVNRVDFIISYVTLFSITSQMLEEDFEIIKSDYQKIVQTIQAGKAHELSESMTMYLAASTKGSTAKKSWQAQYYNPDVKAKRRAFSLKQGYMTYVINEYLAKDVQTYDSPLQAEELALVAKAPSPYDVQAGPERHRIIPDQTLIKNDQISSQEKFERYVVNRIMQYQGLSTEELRRHFHLEDVDSKSILSQLVFTILGIHSNQAEEFVKSETIVKTIRLEKDGKLKEHMSFPVINFLNFSQVDWEDSYIYDYFSTQRFLFVVFKHDGQDYRLLKTIFWNMPMTDLDQLVKEDWLHSQQIIQEGVEFTIKKNRIINNLPKASQTNTIHLRPKAAKAAYLIDGVEYGKGSIERDSDLLPNGDRMTKQAFWLNKDYLLKQLRLDLS